MCEKIEREYGLKQFDHQSRKCGAENRAADMEHHTGIESLLGWIQRECHAQIESAQSWDEMHQVMQANGLTLRERGNGLVFEAADDVIVKASSVDRNFSKNKLEQKLGPFQPSPKRHCQAEAARQYSKKPALSRFGTVGLYGRYQSDRSSVYATRSIEWTKAREQKDRAIKAAKQSGSMKRAFIKLLKGSRLEKKAAYALVSSSLKNDIVQINKTYFKERQLFADRNRRMMWADWLRQRATEGDEEALLALRARNPGSGLRGNTLFGKGKAQGSVGSVPHQDSVTKKGTIIYRMGATAVRDDGDKLNVSRGATHDGLQAALQLAVALWRMYLRRGYRCIQGPDRARGSRSRFAYPLRRRRSRTAPAGVNSAVNRRGEKS